MLVLSESIWFLIIVIISLVVGIVMVQRMNVVAGVKKFELLLTYISAFAALMFTYDIYITIGSNNRIEKNRIAYNTLENIQRSYLTPQKEIVDAYPESFFLYASMNQDSNFDHLKPETFDAAKRKVMELYLSLRIFQSVEDFLSAAAYDITGTYSWINTFLMWMQSPILQDHWKILDFNYADDTRALMARLIEKANYLVELRKQKTVLVDQDYDTISKNFLVAAR